MLPTPPASRRPTALPFDPASVSDEVVLSHAQMALRGGLVEQALTCAAIVAGRSTSAGTRCEALRLQSNAYRLQSAWDQAIAAARAEAHIAEGAALVDRLAEALNAEAAVLLARGDFDDALPLLQRALRAATSPRLLGVLWQNVGLLEAQRRNFTEAEEALDTSRRFFEDAGDKWGSACSLINQGCVRLDHQKDYAGATELLARAINAARAANDLDLVAGAMMNQARAFLRLDRLDDAEFHASSAAGFFISSRMPLRYAECLIVLGDVEFARGDTDIARRCWRRGLETAEELGAHGIRDELRERLQQVAHHSAS